MVWDFEGKEVIVADKRREGGSDGVVWSMGYKDDELLGLSSNPNLWFNILNGNILVYDLI